MIRYLDADPQGDCWDLQAHIDGEWVVVNAGVGSPVGGRFPAGASHWRLVNVWNDGRVIPTDAVPLDDQHIGPARRKFSREERAWLEENGVPERLAATFPRGHSLADIKDALSE